MLLAPLLLAAAPMPDFAVRLWNELPDKGGNVVVSPTSVEACLGLLIPAVGPNSKPPLARTLGTDVAGLPSYQRNLQVRLRSLVGGGETTVSNAAFFKETPRPTYVAAVKNVYGATSERLRSVEQINGWVNDRTKGRIPKLFDRLDPSTHAVLVNAVTFDGDWTKAFPAETTRKADFKTPKGVRSVDLMRQSQIDCLYGEGDGFRMAQLDYKGGRYRLTILLPNSGDPAHLLKENAWRSLPATNRTLDLSLPKFTVRSAPNVQAALGRMGLAPLYRSIDLSSALPGGAGDAIDQIVHKTYVKVDEKGTQAAASTGISVTRSARLPQPKVVFRVDRPFAFAIQRVETGEVLFEGVIREP